MRINKWLIVALSLCLAACGKPLVMKTVFNPTSYGQYMKNGPASIQGQVFLKTLDGEPKYGIGAPVFLMPDDDYLREYLQLSRDGVRHVKTDSRWSDYVRVTQTDAQGNFEFTNVPAMNFAVKSEVTWILSESDPLYQTLSTPIQGGVIYKRVSLSPGKNRVIVTR